MKRKKTILVIGAIMLLALLSACTLLPQSHKSSLIVPSSGHPPFKVTITAPYWDDGGTYEFAFYNSELGDQPYDTIQGEERICETTVHIDPRLWSCQITWIKGNRVEQSDILRVGLENEPPRILRPSIDGMRYDAPPRSDFIGYLQPFQRYTFDFTHRFDLPLWPGDGTTEWGITDPEKDKCRIIDIKCWAEEKGPDNPDSVYTYPYTPREFWINDIPGFMTIPWWTGEPNPIDGRPSTPYPLPFPGNGGYDCLGCVDLDSCDGVNEQFWYCQVTAEDILGARRTKVFVYRLSPVGVDLDRP